MPNIDDIIVYADGNTIHIWESSNEPGYFYDIFKGVELTREELEDAEDADDGGLCTTTIENALGMALSQLK